MLEEETD